VAVSQEAGEAVSRPLAEIAQELMEEHGGALTKAEELICEAIILYGDEADYRATPQMIQKIEELEEEYL